MNETNGLIIMITTMWTVIGLELACIIDEIEKIINRRRKEIWHGKNKQEKQ